MTPPRRELPLGARLGGFAAVLALAFAGAYGAGTVLEDGEAAAGATPSSDPSPAHGHGGAPGTGSTSGGYALSLPKGSVPAGATVPLQFSVIGPDGTPVSAFELHDGAALRVLVLTDDLADPQRLEPVQGAGGGWTALVELADAGTYRLVADFVPAEGPSAGARQTVGADLEALAGPAPAALGRASTTERPQETP
ncbi:hypothetical protein [Motilibacter aurantiacus]|uniref:hypothetical protein n=1 Tax=Motilibacter aurantiacus TaxID=2714955 RepID=UPI0014098DD7|nr:hypothetical protein [Motilibacter aurantiacus]NHC44271.1 hypothetical protein [Motilibacter aurantiacus]